MKMEVVELKTLLCAICGTELRQPRGALIHEDSEFFRYYHAGDASCENSEKICLVLKNEPIVVDVIGKEEWKTLPAKIVPV